MTVSELIELLQEQDPDAEVRYMEQPSWPFEYSLMDTLYVPTPTQTERCCWECMAQVNLVDDEWHHPDPEADADHEPNVADEEDDWQPSSPPEAGCVFLLEGTQLGYGTKGAWSA